MGETLPERYGKYVLLRRIAVGGMAEIFRAKAVGAEGFERDIAIKRILPSYTADDSFVQMFRDEANIAAKLSHANIVHISDFDLHGGTYYIAMEFIEGKDLKQIMDQGLRSGNPPPPLFVTKVIIDICAGLHYAHTRVDKGQPLNIVHRDVSPHNIMVSYNGESKLMDFGIAKARQRFTQTQAGMVKGKCAYMSPEQVRGMELDGRSDLFALGVVMWEMLTRKRLFAGDTDYVTLTNVVKAEVVPPRQLNPDVQPELERIVLKSLKADRDQRYANVAEFQRDLQRFFYSEASSHEVSVQDFMQSLFAESIRVLQTEQAEERKLFQAHLALMEERGEHFTGEVPQRSGSGSRPGLQVGGSAPLPAPPPPGAAPPAEPVLGAATGTLGADLPADDSNAASTIPLGDLQRQLEAHLGGGHEDATVAHIPGSGSQPAQTQLGAPSDSAAAYSGQVAGSGQVARPGTPAPFGISGSDPRVPTGSGVVPEYSGSYPASKSNKLLIAVLSVLVVAVGVTAFFVVRLMQDRAAAEPATAAAESPASAAVIAPVAEEKPFAMTVELDPADSELFVNGERNTSGRVEGLRSGDRLLLRAQKAEHVPHEREIIASPEQSVVLLRLTRLQPTAMRVIVAAPVPAEVTVDGRPRGRSPVQIEGQPGQLVRIEAVAEGYLPFEETMTIEADRPINLPLRKIAPLNVRVAPPEAELSVNGQVLPKSESGEYAVYEFAEGETVSVEADLDRHRKESVEIALPHEGVVELTLRPLRVAPPATPRGTVRLNARPWADVFYRGRRLGRTPYEGRYPVGEHVFVFRKGEDSKTLKVTVRENQQSVHVVSMD